MLQHKKEGRNPLFCFDIYNPLEFCQLGEFGKQSLLLATCEAYHQLVVCCQWLNANHLSTTKARVLYPLAYRIGARGCDNLPHS